MQRSTRVLTGLGLVVGGALLGMLSMTALPWFRSDFGLILPQGSTVSDIRTAMSTLDRLLPESVSLGIAPVYFGWLGIALLLLGALAGFVGAGVSSRFTRVAAVIAVLASLFGLVLTASALQFYRLDGAKLNVTPPSYGDFVSHSSFGAWAIVLGYLLVGVGALLAAGGRDDLRLLLNEDDDEPETEPETEPDDAEPEKPASAVPATRGDAAPDNDW